MHTFSYVFTIYYTHIIYYAISRIVFILRTKKTLLNREETPYYRYYRKCMLLLGSKYMYTREIETEPYLFNYFISFVALFSIWILNRIRLRSVMDLIEQ